MRNDRRATPTRAASTRSTRAASTRSTRSTARRARPPESLSARLATVALSPGLRRVAALLLAEPETISFGTVATVARAAGTSGPTVVRLAHALGYGGFGELRDAARAELSMRLNTDAVRIRAQPAAEPVVALLAIEQANLHDTLSALDQATVAKAVLRLADEARTVWVLPSTQTAGVAARFADQLLILRDGVVLLEGSELRITSRLQALRRGDVLVSLDVPRHELATIRVQREAVGRGAVPLVLAGGLPVALRTDGGLLMQFACATIGPFESLVGLTALTTLLVNGVAAHRPAAAERVRALECAWTTAGLFDAKPLGE
jgi:DNA-binding MurR/RpiR family transcriptional regulator